MSARSCPARTRSPDCTWMCLPFGIRYSRAWSDWGTFSGLIGVMSTFGLALAFWIAASVATDLAERLRGGHPLERAKLLPNPTADLAVGTIGRQTLVTLINARTGTLGGTLTLSGDGAGNLRIFPVEPASPSEPWSLLVADPGNGLRLMSRRGESEPL